MKYLQVLIIGILVIATFLAINKIQESEQTLQIKEIQLKDTTAELQNLNSDYTELLKSDEDNTKELEKLRKKKKELERELQAKREREAEEHRLALIQRAEAQEVAEPDPTPTPQPYVAPAGDIHDIIRNAAVKHGLDPAWFDQLANCESTYNPNAVNYNYYDNGHPSGLYQHLSGYWPQRAADHGYAGASVFDPVANANVTAAMIAGGARSLWEC